MFYEGDLPSGITKAVHESKLVACFVTDDKEESQTWENDFLKEESLQFKLMNQTVLLRLTAGSQEAGYLAAIFPLPKIPTLVVIKNGELKEYLPSGTSKEDFVKRVTTVIESDTTQPIVATPALSLPDAASVVVTPEQRPPTSQPSAVAPVDDQQAATTTMSSSQQAQLAERNARLEAQKKQKDAAEKAKRTAEAKARREGKAPVPPTNSVDQKYAQLQKKRQQEARAERERILKRVEDDKAERREREENWKAETKRKLNNETPATGIFRQASATNAVECSVQVRLFDGSTLRSKFPSSGSLRQHVRPWIDEKMERDTPYSFKQVLSPLPNKNIELAEEDKTLQTLGLTPSATLILMPVAADFTSAYQGGATGLVYGGISAGYGLMSSGVGMVTGLLGSFLGGGGGGVTTEPAQPTQRSLSPAVTSNPSINVRTLRDRERKDDHQFYNGNSINFQPRKDDDDKKDE